MIARQLFIIAVLCVASAWSFSPLIPQRATSHLLSSSSPADALSVEGVNSAFDNYQQNDSQELAYNDVVVGTGNAVETGSLITVAYKARFLAADKKQFDFSEGFVCRIGEGTVLPGWDEGLVGMKVGGNRILRIPPSLAYGDRWFKGTIPPNSHLEFDCELKAVAQSTQEEFMAQLEFFGVGRAIGFVVLTALLALSPMLPN